MELRYSCICTYCLSLVIVLHSSFVIRRHILAVGEEAYLRCRKSFETPSLGPSGPNTLGYHFTKKSRTSCGVFMNDSNEVGPSRGRITTAVIIPSAVVIDVDVDHYY